VLDQEPFGFAGSPPADRARYENRFQVIPAGMTFRPSRQTPKPRIDGVETARVTAEEIAGAGGDGKLALNSDEFGRVRVRFPWDQRENDGTPTSKWVRVAQHWAGAGYGAFHVPRVGHEVLVAYERGDPDRPIILGRVYNQQNQPPYMEANATVSTVKSASATNERASPEDGFNEFRFEDKLGAEQIYLHAQKDLTEAVLGNHSTSVGGDQSSSVQGNQSNVVKGSQWNNVEGGRFHTIVGQEVVYVGQDHRTHYGASELYTVAGQREASVVGSDKLDVGGDRETNVGGLHVVSTKDNHVLHAANFLFYPGTNFQVESLAAMFSQGMAFTAKVGGCELRLSTGVATLTNGAGASISMIGGLITIDAGTVIIKSEGYMQVDAGGAMDLSSSGDMNAKAATIKLNG
jgi:type VI secretion system secreted protein VgrG